MYKLKCRKCKQVKRRLSDNTSLLRHRLTHICPTCGTKMYRYQTDNRTQWSRHPNYFTNGTIKNYYTPR